MSAARTTAPGTVAILAADIKLAHSIFALPFALLAAVMAAAPGGAGSLVPGRFAGQIALVIVAMVTARTVAMLANRILDRRLDAGNPRTAGRALPSGRISVRTVSAALAASACGFILTTIAFGVFYDNWWPLVGAGPVLAWLITYPLAKRRTFLCHLHLGIALALSPLAAALAVAPEALREQPSVWWLAAMVTGWVAGFDVIYALQDEAVDRDQGIHSIPGRFGAQRALWFSRALHAVAAAALFLAFRSDPRFGPIFAAGVAIVLTLLVVEQATVARWGTSRLALTFFTLNGVISCVLGGLGILDILV